jgi:hypothetical protein
MKLYQMLWLAPMYLLRVVFKIQLEVQVVFHYFGLLITRLYDEEDFLHYLWKFKKFDTLNLKTSNNEEITLMWVSI